jgi:hypothetical protein
MRRFWTPAGFEPATHGLGKPSGGVGGERACNDFLGQANLTLGRGMFLPSADQGHKMTASLGRGGRARGRLPVSLGRHGKRPLSATAHGSGAVSAGAARGTRRPCGDVIATGRFTRPEHGENGKCEEKPC